MKIYISTKFALCRVYNKLWENQTRIKYLCMYLCTYIHIVRYSILPSSYSFLHSSRYHFFSFSLCTSFQLFYFVYDRSWCNPTLHHHHTMNFHLSASSNFLDFESRPIRNAFQKFRAFFLFPIYISQMQIVNITSI